MELLASGMNTIHEFLPWTATLVVTSIAARTAFVPFQLLSLRHAALYQRAFPLVQMLQRQHQSRSSLMSYWNYSNARRKLLQSQKYSAMIRWSPTLLYIPWIYTLTVSLRNIVFASPEFVSSVDGASLLTPDDSYILPLALAVTMCGNIAISGNNLPVGSLPHIIVQRLSYLPAVFFPIVTQVPEGLVIVWLSAAIYSSGFMFFTRHPAVREKLGFLSNLQPVVSAPEKLRSKPRNLSL